MIFLPSHCWPYLPIEDSPRRVGESRIGWANLETTTVYSLFVLYGYLFIIRHFIRFFIFSQCLRCTTKYEIICVQSAPRPSPLPQTSNSIWPHTGLGRYLPVKFAPKCKLTLVYSVQCNYTFKIIIIKSRMKS